MSIITQKNYYNPDWL